ncbi:MAG: energy-coupling factor transporter transmembrane component T family protein [Caldimicrobium sp.]
MFLHLYREPSPFFQKVNGKIKFLYFIYLLVLVLSAKSILFLIVIFSLHFFLLYFLIKSFKKLLSFYIEPLWIALLIPLIKAITLSPLSFEVPQFIANIIITLKVLSAFSLFLFFYLTNSFFEILQILHWLKMPTLIRELIFLSYRSLILMHSEVSQIYLSQKIRLGYSNLKNSLHSFSYLIQASFFNSLKHVETLLQSMLQRGYNYSNLPFSLPPLSKREILPLGFLLLFWSSLWIIL